MDIDFVIFECESDANDLVSPQKSNERPIINLSISVVAVYVTYQNRMVPARSSGLCAFLAWCQVAVFIQLHIMMSQNLNFLARTTNKFFMCLIAWSYEVELGLLWFGLWVPWKPSVYISGICAGFVLLWWVYLKYRTKNPPK